mmetsp:Transcript_64091/g.152853  ORF Transcript_64091/g.152853 Transcript_64091/m.152853 type:complete len:413 (-) Transcript_64091:190-1428(-)
MEILASIGLSIPFCLPAAGAEAHARDSSDERPEEAPEFVLLHEEERRHEQSEKLQALLHGRPAIFQDILLDSVEAAAIIVAMLDDVWVNEDHKHHGFRCLAKAVRTPKTLNIASEACQSGRSVDSSCMSDEEDDEYVNIAQEDGLDAWTSGRKDHFCDRHLVVCNCDGLRSSRFISAVCVRRRGLRHCPAHRTMSVDGVFEMIRNLSVGPANCFEKYATSLRQEGIDGPRLLKVTDQDLLEWGVSDQRHRQRILLEVEAAEDTRRVPVVDLLVGGCGFTSRSFSCGPAQANSSSSQGGAAVPAKTARTSRPGTSTEVSRRQQSSALPVAVDVGNCLEAVVPGSRAAASSCICNVCSHAEDVENTIIAEVPSRRVRGRLPGGLPALGDSIQVGTTKEEYYYSGLGPNPFHGGA